MTGVWPGSRLRAAEAAAIDAACAAGDPDRYMRVAAQGIATLVLRHLGRGGAQVRRSAVPVIAAPLPQRSQVTALAGSGVAGARIVALVGPGNNGGDGLYALAALARRGAACTAILLAERHHGRGAQALRLAGGRVRMAGTAGAERALAAASVVLDAALGTGARTAGSARGRVMAWPQLPDAAWRIACDLPSGLDAEGEEPGAGGACAGTEVQPVESQPVEPPWVDTTVALGAPSLGLVLGRGRELCGEVHVVPVPGLLDPTLLGEPAVQLLSPNEALDSMLSPRAGDHKYSRGVLGLVAGSPAYPGAAILCAKAALETGVGMLSAFTRGTARLQFGAAVPEAVVSSRDQAPDGPAASRVNAWVLGPGLGESEQDLDAARRVLASGTPAVVDASALAVVQLPALAPVPVESPAPSRPWILTPHAGELRALSERLGLDLPDPARWPLASVKQAARALRCVVLLKGSCTLVATPQGQVFAAASAGPGLAVAGSGDTLAGILGAVLTTHVTRSGAATPQELARWAAAAAVVHGLAGAAAPGPAEGLSAGIRSVLQTR
ncbi:NAD(P)H-hydrate dehydratase [Galactobacter caseinivorans]|uniref:ADP-dependent (S)-NAD(P)H-hydrate dehydratase n=1 Tax=Galactobacter caseinivorans TaxID=2676123 RepID=A0A496PLT4_9MICC|nr:NAD(P)H-hydrate dehydratase [Galactobacter caseinivorans]RKW71501.1 NAD(P)H-hydrate dehydratase [Galactobacter caseinivorans]